MVFLLSKHTSCRIMLPIFRSRHKLVYFQFLHTLHFCLARGLPMMVPLRIHHRLIIGLRCISFSFYTFFYHDCVVYLCVPISISLVGYRILLLRGNLHVFCICHCHLRRFLSSSGLYLNYFNFCRTPTGFCCFFGFRFLRWFRNSTQWTTHSFKLSFVLLLVCSSTQLVFLSSSVFLCFSLHPSDVLRLSQRLVLNFPLGSQPLRHMIVYHCYYHNSLSVVCPCHYQRFVRRICFSQITKHQYHLSSDALPALW